MERLGLVGLLLATVGSDLHQVAQRCGLFLFLGLLGFLLLLGLFLHLLDRLVGLLREFFLRGDLLVVLLLTAGILGWISMSRMATEVATALGEAQYDAKQASRDRQGSAA